MFGGFGGGIESIFIRISFDMDSPFNSTKIHAVSRAQCHVY